MILLELDIIEFDRRECFLRDFRINVGCDPVPPKRENTISGTCQSTSPCVVGVDLFCEEHRLELCVTEGVHWQVACEDCLSRQILQLHEDRSISVVRLTNPWAVDYITRCCLTVEVSAPDITSEEYILSIHEFHVANVGTISVLRHGWRSCRVLEFVLYSKGPEGHSFFVD
jgi:hypothetical protein